MFYDRRPIKYNIKTLLEDVLARSGVPDSESWTPYSGMHHLIIKFLGASLYQTVTIADIVSASEEYNENKQRVNEDFDSRDSYLDIDDYYQRLEDISEEYIQVYVEQQLIGFMHNDKGMRKYKSNMHRTLKLVDQEDSSIVRDESDFLIAVESDVTTAELLEARSRLPGLLKILHEGSKTFGGSLLSFIIARERAKRTMGDNITITPSLLENFGTLYKMSRDGSIYGVFSVARDNTSGQFPVLHSLTAGRIRDNDSAEVADLKKRYYRVGIELLKVCEVLKVDITEEDAKEFDESSIRQIVCSYLLSNQEYIELYGTVDRAVVDALSGGELFQTRKHKLIDKYLASPVAAGTMSKDLNDIAGSIADNTYPLFTIKPDIWRSDIDLTNKILEIIYERFNKGFKPVSEYKKLNGFLLSTSGKYLILKLNRLMTGIGGMSYDRSVMVSITGKLVCVEPIESTGGQILYMTYSDLRRREFNGWNTLDL